MVGTFLWPLGYCILLRRTQPEQGILRYSFCLIQRQHYTHTYTTLRHVIHHPLELFHRSQIRNVGYHYLMTVNLICLALNGV